MGPITHDHKGYSEERCIRCGWVMGNRPLNCNNDDTPHIFPSQLPTTVADAARLLLNDIDEWETASGGSVPEKYGVHKSELRKALDK